MAQKKAPQSLKDPKNTPLVKGTNHKWFPRLHFLSQTHFFAGSSMMWRWECCSSAVLKSPELLVLPKSGCRRLPKNRWCAFACWAQGMASPQTKLAWKQWQRPELIDNLSMQNAGIFRKCLLLAHQRREALKEWQWDDEMRSLSKTIEAGRAYYFSFLEFIALAEDDLRKTDFHRQEFSWCFGDVSNDIGTSKQTFHWWRYTATIQQQCGWMISSLKTTLFPYIV